LPARHCSEVEQWAAKRQLYVDNLKVILIAAVIAGHAILGYSEFDWWTYADVREVTLLPVVAYVLLAVAAPFALLVIPLLFLIAGLLTPPSLPTLASRRGPPHDRTDQGPTKRPHDHKLTACPQCRHSGRTSRNETVRYQRKGVNY
jgi:hypothetical protein